MTNYRIDDLIPKTLPFTGGELAEVSNGGAGSRKVLTRHLGLTDITSITYNSDGTIASKTDGGVTTTYTWASGLLQSKSDGTITETYSYDDNNRLTGRTIT